MSIATQWKGLMERKSEQIMKRVVRAATFFAQQGGIEFFFFKDGSVLDSEGGIWTKSEWEARFGEAVCDDCGAKAVITPSETGAVTRANTVPMMEHASN